MLSLIPEHSRPGRPRAWQGRPPRIGLATDGTQSDRIFCFARTVKLEAVGKRSHIAAKRRGIVRVLKTFEALRSQ